MWAIGADTGFALRSLVRMVGATLRLPTVAQGSPFDSRRSLRGASRRYTSATSAEGGEAGDLRAQALLGLRPPSPELLAGGGPEGASVGRKAKRTDRGLVRGQREGLDAGHDVDKDDLAAAASRRDGAASGMESDPMDVLELSCGARQHLPRVCAPHRDTREDVA